VEVSGACRTYRGSPTSLIAYNQDVFKGTVRTDRFESRVTGGEVLKNFKAMPSVLKWLTAVSLVPPIFFLGTLIANGSINVNGRPMPNSVWWACGAGAIVAVLAVIMAVAVLMLVRRSKYARPVLLVGMTSTFMSGTLLTKLTGSNITAPLWLDITNLIPVAAIAAYLYANKAVRKYFQWSGT
jgi:hypothetical protein